MMTSTIANDMNLRSILLVMPFFAVGCRGTNVTPAVHKSLLLQFAKDQFPGYEVKGTSITDKDIDNDGYVSGTLTITKNGEPGFRVIGVDIPLNGEAATPENGSGCKLSREQLHENKF
jgi:hypothetical protein